jgi:hypothetical protein
MKPRPAYFWSFAWPFLLVLLLVGSISYIDPASSRSGGDIATGKYLLKADLNGEHTSLEGIVYYEYTSQSQGGVDKSIFKLHFLDASDTDAPGFGFLIPLNNSANHIEKDTYRVDPNGRGFMNGFGTVYGYADLHTDEGKLYFTESGSISIGETMVGEEVVGNLEIVMDDGSGGTIRLEGDFKARRLPPSIKL